VPLALFRSRSFAAANGVNALVGVALIAGMVDVPLFAATVLGRSPIAAGLALLRLTALIPVGAVVGGWLVARLRWDAVSAAGLLLASGGFFLMSRWTLAVSDAAMTPGLVLAGLGFGLVVAPVTTAVLAAVGEKDRALSTLSSPRKRAIVSAPRSRSAIFLPTLSEVSLRIEADPDAGRGELAYDLAVGQHLSLRPHQPAAGAR